MRTRLGVAFVVAVLAVTVAAGSARSESFLPGDELRSAQLLNTARAALGLTALARRPELDAMARAQAARMAARGEIYHNPNLGSDATKSGLNWVRMGENVGVGPDVLIVHNAFLASPHHRDNMLFPAYNSIGVGIVPGTGNRSGMIFIAHVFGQVVGAAKSAPVYVAPRPVRTVRKATVLETPRPTPLVTSSPVTTPRPPSVTPNAVVGGVVDRSLTLA
jgi:uncharacterized protein YkwD